MKKYAIYIRVSTVKQGESHLGLESQQSICMDYIKSVGGEFTRLFQDVESGKSCTRKGLWDAIDYCKKNEAVLVFAKLDRLARNVEFTFRVINTGIETHFCDMPVVNTIILGVFASVAQYERELTSGRTKNALKAKIQRGEDTGGTNALWGKRTYSTPEEAAEARIQVMNKAHENSARSRTAKAKANPNNVAFADFLELWIAKYGKINRNTDWDKMAEELNARGKKTSTGMDFNGNRAHAMYYKVKGWKDARFV